VRKVVWEAGPAARRPDWSLVPDRQRIGAQQAFNTYLTQQRLRPEGIQQAMFVV